MIQALIAKAIIKKVMDAVEKADDKRIARSHHKRIKKLEKMAHPKKELICKCCKNKEHK
mgnify:CR=1 FL=1